MANALAKRGSIKKGSELFGKAFEHFIMNEIRAYLVYQDLPDELCYWRSTSQFEVDAVIGTRVALEIKATEHVNDYHLKGLKALKEEGLIKNYYLVSLDKNERTIDGIQLIYYENFLKKIKALI